MANYPDVAYTYDSRREVLSGTEIDTATDGSVRGRNLYSETTYRFRLMHRNITASEKDAILASYAANKTSTITLTWGGDGVSYSVLYEREPEASPSRGKYWAVETTLIGRPA